MDAAPLKVLAVAVGNTRTRVARFSGRPMSGESQALPSTDAPGLVRAIQALAKGEELVVISSVNELAAAALERELRPAFPERVYRFGRDLEIPIANALTDDSTVGQDRLLCAIGASVRAEQACVVVDAGTAITVDFVDGEGTFQGGVIAPGVQMMLDALHARTAALPQIKFALPDAALGPFGKDSPHAMRLGVLNAARGLVRHTIEQYAQVFGGYPQIVATGGDALALFEHDDLVEHIVPDLQLIGIAEACARVLEGDGAPRPKPARRPSPLDDDDSWSES